MRVNEVVEITKGALLNTPSISSLSRIICDVEQVRQGDLFIALDDSLVAQAVESGAYGIICNANVKVSDDEIAWIVVDDLQECLMRLIRYKLLARNITTIALSSIEDAIAREIVSDDRARFTTTSNVLKDSLCEVIELLNEEQVAFIFTRNEKILSLSFEVAQSHQSKEKSFSILSHTLFDTTIFYKSAYYRINLPKLFLNELNAVLSVCENKQIAYAINQFKHITFFKPNFLNAFGKLVEFGQASKVAIAEEDIEQFKKYMAYIANNATWGKFLFLVPPIYLELFNQIAQTFAYESQEELCKYLHNENYNFALVLGISDEVLVNALENHQKRIVEPDLFSNLLVSENGKNMQESYEQLL